jgi:hypothetical protein
MDTDNWTVEDHIAWIREYARQSKDFGKRVISWDLDALRVYVGLAEVIPFPEPEPRQLRRGSKTRDVEVSSRPEGSRVIHHGGYAYLIRDTV